MDKEQQIIRDTIRKTIEVVERSRTMEEEYAMGEREESARQQVIADLILLEINETKGI